MVARVAPGPVAITPGSITLERAAEAGTEAQPAKPVARAKLAGKTLWVPVAQAAQVALLVPPVPRAP